MALDGCLTIVRYLLIAWDCLLGLAGLAMLGVGIWMALDPHAGQTLEGELLADSPVVISYSSITDFSLLCILAYCLIGMGIVIALVTVLDIVGATLQKRALLITALSLLALMLMVMIGGGVYFYVSRADIDISEDKLLPHLRTSLREAVNNYHDDEQSAKFMDKVQEMFKCCGADNGGGDYAPIMRLPCKMLYSDTPCLPPYFEHVKEKIGIQPFFEGRMTLGAGIIFGAVGMLVVTLILTGILILVAAREED